jgi:glyoxylase-like metal-dependent hydrolase (beta-lactamase superfamily II)
VFLTHLHHDHIGAAAAVSNHFCVPVVASERTAADLRAGGGSGASTGGFSLEDLPAIDRWVGEGDWIAGRWRVLETPGHAHGHLCLFDEATRTLIAGDMLADGSTVVIEPDQGDMSAYLTSLERLAALRPHLIIAAHGMPIARGAAAFKGLIDHRLRREARVRSALEESGGGDLPVLVRLAYADTPEFLWPLAQLSLESHLIRLIECGEVCRTGTRYMLVQLRADR